MSRLAGAIDGVIGVDTHRDTLAAATDMVGGLLAQTSVRADAAGYRRLLEFAQAQVPGRRCWAVEGAGGYGAGVAPFQEAAFAALAGANPIPASSGQVTRHRLNRSGDRQLNRALHTVVVARLRDDPATRAYAARHERGQERPRYPPVLEAGRRPAAAQAAGTLRPRWG